MLTLIRRYNKIATTPVGAYQPSRTLYTTLGGGCSIHGRFTRTYQPVYLTVPRLVGALYPECNRPRASFARHKFIFVRR